MMSYLINRVLIVSSSEELVHQCIVPKLMSILRRSVTSSFGVSVVYSDDLPFSLHVTLHWWWPAQHLSWSQLEGRIVRAPSYWPATKILIKLALCMKVLKIIRRGLDCMDKNVWVPSSYKQWGTYTIKDLFLYYHKIGPLLHTAENAFKLISF